jgi:hypothetical protein
MATILPFVMKKSDFDDELPDQGKLSGGESPNALSKPQRRASAIRLACALLG